MSTDTPRTDVEEIFVADPWDSPTTCRAVVSDFARALERELAAMTKERDEQCRLLGKSGSREAKLLAEIESLKKENARIIANHGCARNQGTTQFCAEVLSVQKERDELQQHADALAGALDDMGFSWVPSLEAYRASQQPKP
jgi:hypothetical protein